MKLHSLIPTHNYLRDPGKIPNIMADIANNRFENNEPCVVFKINNEYYIWNGHHRLKATHLMGFTDTMELPFEVVYKTMKLEELMSVNFAASYVTPFDPRFECRKPEFFAFKQRVMYIFKEWDFQEALYFITERHSQYAEPRDIYTLEELS